MKTVIHTITPIITQGIRQLDDIRELERPDLEVRHSILDKGPASIESEFDEALSVPDTIKKAIEAEQDGAHAIVIDCMGDPGLDACREVVSIPVLGPCQTSMYAAGMLAHSFGFITVLGRLRPLIDNMVSKYGIDAKYVSFQAINIPVLEISHDPAKLNEALTEKAILSVQQDGADAIILGCTGFLGCAVAMRRGLLDAGLDVPVIDPIPLAVHVAEALVKTGLSHSRRTWPLPDIKGLAGYDMPGFPGTMKQREVA
ncbi:MAG: aspartate/glutamate racemase family protein [Gammaproteobacteria bacterium]|nr:aspartate/glutamate racemase family protein [Gammaproteobacteria bacterium]